MNLTTTAEVIRVIADSACILCGFFVLACTPLAMIALCKIAFRSDRHRKDFDQ